MERNWLCLVCEDEIRVEELFCKSSFLFFNIQVDFFGEIASLPMAFHRVEGRRDLLWKKDMLECSVHPNVKNLFRFAKKLSSYNENLPGSPIAYLFVLSSETNHH